MQARREGVRPTHDEVADMHTIAAGASADAGARSENYHETVTIVTTPLELIMAVNQSDPYIEIRAHLDFTGFQLPAGNTHVLGDVPTGVLSIQVLY